ncbi:hypothetical protein EC991_009920 [Linnemannia zychae]|nr:hypothetical protein EC991_009920 [Linnemannia zychae]
MSKSFEDIFRAFPQLVEYHDDFWSLTVVPELIQHWDPLNNSISELLSSLSRLRVMAIPYQMISGEHILENPWVCLDLEEFSCQIAGLPFLTKEQKEIVQEIHHRENQIDGRIQPGDRNHEEIQLMNLSKRCISTRKAIMTQLSKLTSLKYLSLSSDVKNQDELFEQRFGATLVYKSERDGRSYIQYNDVLPDTPHLRLDSGLEELASLTQLEYLGFESMDHQMDTAEIEWVAKHFPRLKEMRGLVTENYVGIEPDAKNDTLLALIRKLRPDVVQGQSFERYTPRPAFGFFGGGFGAPSTGSLFS